jgi:NNP family nitrate/nitrite transporter-like MFS transporter
MFAKNVVGAANAMTGGWGNCGGGMAIMIMGYIYEGFRDEGMSQENAWRRSFYIPAVAVMVVAVCMFFFSDECPSGKLTDALAAGKREKVTVKESTRGGFTNLNSWILFVQYATCFGIELHINNGMAMYFKDTYPVSLATAGLIASLFGWMNLFARGLGGYFSDLANAKLGMQGRIIVHTLYLLAEGAILVIFSRVDNIAHAIITLVLFSCCVQAAEGTTFAIVPYVAPKALGSVSGVVGAGGNVGAVAWGLMFMFGDSGKTGYRNLGIIIMASALLSVFIKIKGAGSLFGNDDSTEGDEAPAAKGEEI